MKAAVVTGIVTPYTHRLFEALGRRLDGGLHVFACTGIEPGRHWTLPPAASYRRRVLGGVRLHRSYVSHVYLNPGIVPALVGAGFDVITVCDFSPTMMIAATVGFATGTPVVIQTDAQPETDPGQWSLPHRLARRLIVPRCRIGLGASRGSLEVLERYGLSPERGVLAPLAPGWDFSGDPPPFEARPFDLMFCGHLDDDRKGLLFFLDVVEACLGRGFRPQIRVTGEGPLRAAAEARLSAAGVEARFDGYLPQEALGEAYASAKLFLFPSRGDPWGLVGNEALQCGTPVLASPHARVAHELVQPFGAGAVLDLEVEAWTGAALRHLTDRPAWDAAHARAAAAARSFSVEAMAAGFLEAFSRAAAPRPALLGQRG
ncbi:MAG TPA: glycosyltransferase family 4 protein [Beijerinckiaceae bacterium]